MDVLSMTDNPIEELNQIERAALVTRVGVLKADCEDLLKELTP